MREKTASLMVLIILAVLISVILGLFKGDTLMQVLPLLILALGAGIVLFGMVVGRRILDGKLVTKEEYEEHQRRTGSRGAEDE